MLRLSKHSEPFFSNLLGDKKRPLDEVRDFSPVRQALKELDSGK
jgi:hypothetical protein